MGWRPAGSQAVQPINSPGAQPSARAWQIDNLQHVRQQQLLQQLVDCSSKRRHESCRGSSPAHRSLDMCACAQDRMHTRQPLQISSVTNARSHQRQLATPLAGSECAAKAELGGWLATRSINIHAAGQRRLNRLGKGSLQLFALPGASCGRRSVWGIRLPRIADRLIGLWRSLSSFRHCAARRCVCDLRICPRQLSRTGSPSQLFYGLQYSSKLPPQHTRIAHRRNHAPRPATGSHRGPTHSHS